MDKNYRWQGVTFWNALQYGVLWEVKWFLQIHTSGLKARQKRLCSGLKPEG
jgi:hypothetical protein